MTLDDGYIAVNISIDHGARQLISLAHDGHTQRRTALGRLHDDRKCQRCGDRLENALRIQLSKSIFGQSDRSRGLNTLSLDQNLGNRLVPGQTGALGGRANERHSG